MDGLSLFITLYRYLLVISLWPLGFSALITLLYKLIGMSHSSNLTKLSYGELISVFWGTSTLGTASGLLIGLSRNPAVGAVMPAVLSILSGFVAYMFGKDSVDRALIALSVGCLTMSLMFGGIFGAVSREAYQQFQVGEQHFQNCAYIELHVNEFRRALGLEALTSGLPCRVSDTGSP